MTITWNRDAEDLEINGEHFRVTNNVRNEIDPKFVRKLHKPSEVVYAIVDGKPSKVPYMPRKFPKGICEITSVEVTSAKDFKPLLIRTDATQPVTVWALDPAGGYDHPTAESVIDGGYHLHYSWSITTLGCGRAFTEQQIRDLAKLVRAELLKGPVYLEVV